MTVDLDEVPDHLRPDRFFGRMVMHRDGWAAFARQRLVRIGVPMVAAWPPDWIESRFR